MVRFAQKSHVCQPIPHPWSGGEALSSSKNVLHQLNKISRSAQKKNVCQSPTLSGVFGWVWRSVSSKLLLLGSNLGIKLMFINSQTSWGSVGDQFAKKTFSILLELHEIANLHRKVMFTIPNPDGVERRSVAKFKNKSYLLELGEMSSSTLKTHVGQPPPNMEGQGDSSLLAFVLDIALFVHCTTTLCGDVRNQEV